MNGGVLAWSCLCLGLALIIAIYMLAAAVKKIWWLSEDLQAATDREHTKCMGAVMKFVGDEWAAQVLDVAAHDYASAEAQHDLDRIARLVYKPGGPPVPTLWLAERADRLRILAATERDLADAIEHARVMNINEVVL